MSTPFMLLLLTCVNAGRMRHWRRLGLPLSQPKLHQLDFRLLVGDDLLRQPAHLRVLAVCQLGFRHIDSRLVVRKHQSDEISVIVAAGPHRSHGSVHHLHTSDQLGPLGLWCRHASVRMRVLSPFNRRKGQNQNPKNRTSPNSLVHFPPPHFLTTFMQNPISWNRLRKAEERGNILSLPEVISLRKAASVPASARIVGLPQHYLRRVVGLGHDEESMRRLTLRGSGLAGEAL